MTDLLQFALLGLGAGAIYALVGQGLVVIYQGSGILNLAHGAFAMVGAYLFYELTSVREWGTVPAIAVVVVVTAALGGLVDQLVIRRLRGASALTRLIATLGIFVVVQAATTIRYGANPTLIAPVLEQRPVELLGATVSSDRLWLLAIAVLTTVVLTLTWRFSRIGWAMTAVAESPRSAAAMGWSPERISALNWAVGSGLAGLAGLLIAPITQLSVTSLSLLVIPGLAAALIGGFSSFGLTLAGGLLLGVAQSETQNATDLTGAATSVPFFVIVVVLFVRGSSLPLRGYLSDRLPRVGSGTLRPVAIAAFAVVATVLIATVLDDGGIAALTTWFAIATILLSLVVTTGYAGQLSLAQMAIAGIGALAAARLAEGSVPFPLALVGGAIAGGLVGGLVALPALRTRGVELAAVTLGLGAAADAMLFNSSSVTGSSAGTSIGSLSLFGLDVTAFDHGQRYALVALAVFGLAALATTNLRRGRSGRRLLAVRTNERAASAIGISVRQAKLHAFLVGGAIAGTGGVMLAFSSTTVVYDQFEPLNSIAAVSQAVIGGVGYVTGPLAGATLAPGSVGEQLSGSDSDSAAEYLPLISGLLLLALLMAAPNGLADAARRLLFRWVRRRVVPLPVQEPAAVARRVTPQRLTVEQLGVRYGGVVAVDDVSFAVDAGQVVALIGPNGAGKTSVVDAISGFTRSTGIVRLGEEDITSWPPHRRARAGLVRSFQSLELFEDLTVRENLLAAGERRDAGSMATDLVRPGVASLSSAAKAAIEAFELGDALDRYPAELPYGRRRLVAVARAVAAEPSVLLLDEPAAGLDEAESREFATLVRRLVDERGLGVLVIEHDLDFVMTLSDEVVVVDFGRTIAQGPPSEVREDPAAVAAYLGVDGDEAVIGGGKR